jgi:predicted enzyme related to lactoylglutathione lyase
MNRVVHFEYPVSEPEKSIQFYTDVFGWKFEKWNGPMDYWTITTGDSQPGINGGLMRRHDPSQPVAVTVEVADLDGTLDAIKAAGGEIALPKMPIPGIGWLAYFKDPDGLISGIMQPDPNAKV